MDTQETTPTTQELNLAAKIATTRGVDFETALELVLGNPEGAEAAASAKNRPASQRTAFVGAHEIQELLMQVYARGRADEAQDAEIAALKAELQDLREQQAINSGEIIAIAHGVGGHLKQHHEVNTGDAETISPEETIQDMLETLESLDINPKVREAIAKRFTLPSSTMRTNGATLNALPAPQDLEPNQPPKRRGIFG